MTVPVDGFLPYDEQQTPPDQIPDERPDPVEQYISGHSAGPHSEASAIAAASVPQPHEQTDTVPERTAIASDLGGLTFREEEAAADHVPEKTRVEREIPKGSELLYADVSMHGIDSAAHELKQRGARVVALDLVCENEEGRKALSEKYTYLVSAEAARAAQDPKSSAAKEWEQLRYGPQSGSLSSNALAQLYGSDIKIEIVGLTEDHQDFAMSKQAGKDLESATMDQLPMEEIKDRLLQCAQEEATHQARNDDTVAQQLEELAHRYPGQKIGALRLPGGRLAEKLNPNLPAEKVVFNRMGLAAPPTKSHHHRLVDQLRDGNEPSDDMLNRATLEEVLYQTHGSPGLSAEAEPLITSIDQMSSPDVASKLDELEEARQASANFWEFRNRTADFVNDFGPDFARKTPPQPRAGTERCYFFNVHTEKAGARIAEEIKDRGLRVLALEMSTDSETHRASLSNSLTYMASEQAASQMRDMPGGETARYMHFLHESLPLVGSIVEGLRGTNARICIIDMPKDYLSGARSISSISAEMQQLGESSAPVSEMRKALLHAADQNARYQALREQYMAYHVNSLSELFPDEPIAIAPGQAHRALFEKAGDTTLNSEYIFIDGMGNNGVHRLPFLQLTHEMRTEKMGPSATTVNRAILAGCLWGSYEQTLTISMNSAQINTHFRNFNDALIRRSPEQLEAIIAEVDRIKAQATSPTDYKERASLLVSALFSQSGTEPLSF